MYSVHKTLLHFGDKKEVRKIRVIARLCLFTFPAALRLVDDLEAEGQRVGADGVHDEVGRVLPLVGQPDDGGRGREQAQLSQHAVRELVRAGTGTSNDINNTSIWG